uniref:Sodium/solute symporter n=1 Tax=Steinernema glaseri TaxID=37863 RepID=A0A1I7YX77_9BILA
MDAPKQINLAVIDYVIFCGFMCISIGVGVYYAVVNRSRKDVFKSAAQSDDYLMGGRRMPYFPVAMSLLTTFLSGKAILGTPAEIFDHGLLWIIHFSMSAVAFLISGFIFVPIFFHLSTTSIYEYLELRFHSAVIRKLCAAVFIANNLVYMGVVVYGPAVALSSVTSMPTFWTIILVGCSSTLYTTIGGLKAVVWTDTLQAGVMFAGMLALMAKGTVDVGGFGRMFEVATASGRMAELWRFDPDPALYMSFWTSTLGAICIWLSLYGVNQMAVQRYCSVPTLKDAQKVVFITIPLYFLLSMMVCFIGLLVLTYFYNCNPLETGEITTYDQLVVLFAARVAENYPGFPGLLLACIFAATLSTVSTGYNSMAAVIYNDYIRPHYGDGHALLINKVLVFLSGLVSTAIAFSVEPLGGIVRSSVAILGATRGPVVGLFFLGVFARKVSTRATVVSFVGSIGVCLFLWLCSVVENPYKDYHMPTNSSEEGCHGRPFNLTHIPPYDGFYGRPDTLYFSRISPFSYALIGMIFVFFPALLLSHCMPPREERFSSGRRHSLTLMGRPCLKM